LSRIRILHVIEAIDGGVKRHLLSIVASLDRERFDLEVAGPTARPETGEGATFVADLEAHGVPFHPIEMRRSISVLHDLRSLATLCSLIRRRDFDIVHGHSSKGGFLARLAGWLTGRTTLYTPNALYFLRHPPGRKRSLYVALERLARPFTSAFVAVSPSERDVAVHERLVPADKIVVIPNAIEPEWLAPIPSAREEMRAELGIPDSAVVVGCVARLTPQKDPESLVRAVGEVIVRTKTPVYFVWVGDGELADRVGRLVHESGHEERYRLVGFRRDVRRVMCCFDVFALTSRYEGMPYALLEAMALGLPVVATDVIGTRDVVENAVNGFLVPPASPSATAAALLPLVESRALRAEIGRRGHATVAERYTLDAMTGRLESLYAEVVTRPLPVGARRVPRESGMPA
jgi:glycosyltransferase involved in cell wall biosynthesis